MTRVKVSVELLIMLIMLYFIYQAGRSIIESIERQVFLHQQKMVLKAGQAQTEQINKELREGLLHYQSSSGLERLARERLNVAGPGEMVIRLGK